MKFKTNLIQGWHALRLPLAIIFHAFSVITLSLTAVYAKTEGGTPAILRFSSELRGSVSLLI